MTSQFRLKISLRDLSHDFAYNNRVTIDNSSSNHSPLTEKLIALWLKHDPFVKIVAGGNEEIRRDAMLALLGEKAAKRYIKGAHVFTQTPMVYPRDVRREETEFLQSPDKRDKIIHELIHWGSNVKINQENPESHKTRVQIVHSLLGPLFLNSNSEQEKLLIEGLKVLVVTKTTSMGRTGEISPLVHEEILKKIGEILRYNWELLTNKHKSYTETVARAQLLKTIQSLKDRKHRSAYYVADDQANRRRLLEAKFPLKSNTYNGLIEIARHYLFSAWGNFRSQAKNLLMAIGEKAIIPSGLDQHA